MEGFEELQLGVWTLHTSGLGENSLEAEADVVVPSCLRTCQRPRVTSHERKKLENGIRVARHSVAPQVSLQIGRNIDFRLCAPPPRKYSKRCGWGQCSFHRVVKATAR